MITGRRAYPRWLVRGLVLFAIGMTAFAAVTSRAYHAAENARDQVLSQYVALESRNLEHDDPALAMQLALIAYRVWPTVDARSALLDVTAGEMPARWPGKPGQTQLALGDDGHRLAIGYQSEGQVKVYALRYAQLTPLSTVAAGSSTARLDAVAISPSGQLLATGDSAGGVALWSLASPTHPRRLATLRAGAGAVHGLSFSPGAAGLAAADADGSVHRWSLAQPRNPAAAPLLVAPGRPALEAVSYSHSGNTLTAVGRRGSLVSWGTHGSTRPLEALRSGAATLTAVTYSPDGRWLVVGGKDGQTVIRRLNAAGHGAPVGSLSATGAVTSLTFSRDGRYLAAGTSDRSARIWSTSGWNPVANLPHPAGVTGVAFSDGDRRLLTSDVAGTTVVWEFPSPTTYTTGSAVTGLSFSATAPRLAVITAGAGTQAWDVVDEWHPAPVGAWDAVPRSAAPSNAYWLQPAATTTTSTGTTTTTTAVNPAAGHDALAQTRKLTSVTSSILSPNGQLFVAAGGDGLVYLWNLSDPSHPKLVNKLAGPSSAITALALDPNGDTLAVATVDGDVWLFTAGLPARAQPVATLTAAGGKVTALAFSPSDDTLVAGGSDGRLTFWHFRPYQAVNRICAYAGTPISANEWKQYVPEAAYRPPCARWTPPRPRTTPSP